MFGFTNEGGSDIAVLVVAAGLVSSRSQAKRDIEDGGIYLNNVRVTDSTRRVRTADLLFGKYVLLRKGKKSYAVLTAR